MAAYELINYAVKDGENVLLAEKDSHFRATTETIGEVRATAVCHREMVKKALGTYDAVSTKIYEVTPTGERVYLGVAD